MSSVELGIFNLLMFDNMKDKQIFSVLDLYFFKYK
jgi:hypothetical protein